MEEQTLVFFKKGYALAVILVAGTVVFFVGQLSYQQKALDQQNQNQITISGEGKVYAKPDVAIISLGVTTQGTTVADVTKNSTDKMNAVIDTVKKLGVEDKDIETTNYNLSPRYETQPVVYNMMYPTTPVRGSSQEIVGYTLDQNIQVKIRDFTKIGDIISQSTAAGSNLVGSLQFSIDNPEQYREQARAQAIVKAKANAKNLAKESGVKLGRIINVYENYNPYYATASKAVGMGGGVAESAPMPTIEPGQQEVNVTINLTYRVQ